MRGLQILFDVCGCCCGSCLATVNVSCDREFEAAIKNEFLPWKCERVNVPIFVNDEVERYTNVQVS